MEEVELACAVARRDFGPVVSVVLRALLQYPGLRHGEVRGRCGDAAPSQRAVDDALAVLLTHGIARAEARPPPRPPRIRAERPKHPAPHPPQKKPPRRRDDDGAPLGAVLVYKAFAENVVCRTRCARYLWLVGRMHGERAQKIAKLLMQRGRMTAKGIAESFRKSGATEDEIAEVERVMIIMVKSGTMRWQGRADKGPVAAGTIKVIVSADENTGHKSDAESDESYDPELEPQREQEARRRHDLELALANVTEDEDNPMCAAYNTNVGKLVTGRGFNRKLLDPPLRTNADDVWILSMWFLDAMFRNYTCQQVVRGLLLSTSSESATEHCVMVFRVGLNVAIEMDDPDVHDQNPDMTQEVTFFDIRKALDRGGYEIDDFEFQEAIQTLIDIRPVIATVSPPHAPTAIVFYTARTISFTRHATLLSTLQQKYELQGLRVWNALALHGCMQEKMIADKTMIDVKSVREILYKLMAGGFVSPQEVPKSIDVRGERSASSIWYLWRADVIKAQERLLSDALRATLRVLLKAEQLRNAPLDDEENTAEKKTVKLKLLEATVNRLDQLIILFRDFGPIVDDYWTPLYDLPDYGY